MPKDEKPFVHPEQLEGEFLLSNGTYDDFENKCGWKTKRMGYVAYANGSPLTGAEQGILFPVFVSRAEFEAAGLDPDNLS